MKQTFPLHHALKTALDLFGNINLSNFGKINNSRNGGVLTVMTVGRRSLRHYAGVPASFRLLLHGFRTSLLLFITFTSLLYGQYQPSGGFIAQDNSAVVPAVVSPQTPPTQITRVGHQFEGPGIASSRPNIPLTEPRPLHVPQLHPYPMPVPPVHAGYSIPPDPRQLGQSSSDITPAQHVVPRPVFTSPAPSVALQYSNPSNPPTAPLPPTPLAKQDTVTKNYRLKQLSSDQFEEKLLSRLGTRFVPVRNVESNANLSRFRIPGRDGSKVELSLDRQNNIVTIAGSPQMTEACVQILSLLDTRDNLVGTTTEFLPFEKANAVAFKQTAQIMNHETQKPAVPATAAPAFQQNRDRSEARFTKPETQASQPADTTGSGSIVGPVQIDIIDGLDTMVIRGHSKDVATVLSMLRQIEEMSLEHEPVLELVPLRHADSYRISQMVQQLYSQVYLSRRGAVTMLPLVKPNTILLVGKQESIDTAKELITKLDTAVDPNSEFLVIRLKNASSDSLQTQLTQFYANRSGQGLETQVFIVSDYRTNSLLVQGSPRDLTEVASMILQLDTPGSDATNMVKTFPLKNAMASELATTLQNAISGTGSSGTGGFSGASSGTQSSRTRGHMLEMGTIDANGNLLRANVLYDVRITADTRSNIVIVSAPSESMPLIEALIKQLDQLPSAESQIKVFTLVNGDASTLTTVLQNLFAQTSSSGGGFGGGTSQSSSQIATVRPGIEEGESTLVSVRFQTDTRTNSIIACGSAGDMSIVEALLLRLDEENMNNRKVMVLKLVNTPASQIATAIQNYVTNERQLEIQNSSTYYPQSPREQYLKEVVVVAESLSNTLIISTTPRYYDQIRKIVCELDERPLMVAIQVLIAEVRLENNKELGMELGLQDSLLFNRSSVANNILTPGFLFGDPSKGLPTENVNSSAVGSQGITSLGVNRVGSNGYGGFTFSASSESVSVLVRALEEKRKLRVLSRPSITALHNLPANLQIGQMVPYVTGADTNNSGGTSSSVDYIDVGLILSVTPRITPDGMVVMNIYAEKSKVGSEEDGIPIYTSGDQIIRSPKVDMTKAQTTISTMDGQTVVFAGLITEEKESINRGVPLLNKIPIVKHFFEFNTNVCVRSELLIIMTPTIIRSEMDLEILRQQETSRMHWCINDVVKMTGNSQMRLRTDEWNPCDVGHSIRGEAIIPHESMIPSEEKFERHYPTPSLAPSDTGVYYHPSRNK